MDKGSIVSILIPQPKVKHLMNRASFGLGISEDAGNTQQLFQKSRKIIPLDMVKIPELDKIDLRSLKNDPTKKQMIKDLLGKSRQEFMKLNVAWVDKMVSESTLRERMTFFWHGHFACRTLIPYFAQQQNNAIRALALGSFRDLLISISKDPAMLQFLNNQQNRKDHPNENFAREVMELFTLGRGNYSEKDIKEAARAFTGWSFNTAGQYQFREKQHDFGNKIFRGKSKNFTGEEVINSILDDKASAKFITIKLYKYFVSDSNISPSAIEDWSTSFYNSDYDIQKLLTKIFNSSEFNDPSNIATRIKSPVDLLIGIQRQTNGRFDNPQSLVFLERALGQILFYPPNVSGWPSGKGWIDSSSLAFRLTIPMLLFGGVETDFEARDDGDANGLGKEERSKRKLQCNADWAYLADKFTKTSSSDTLQSVQEFLLSKNTTAANQQTVGRVASAATNDQEFIKKAFIGYMSVPEYQLC